MRTDLARLGLEIYPGAVLASGISTDRTVGQAVRAELRSSDPFDKVAAFYRAKYPQAPAVQTQGSCGRMLTIEVSPLPDAKQVSIADNQDVGGTAIMLLHTDARADGEE
jgi:hypothetical protein